MHIFITGEKHVGKSTLVNKVLEKTSLPYGGVFSVSIFRGPDRMVYLTDEKGSEKTLCGICSSQHITDRRPRVFDTEGVRLLEKAASNSLVVIDEIGNMENEASVYLTAIEELLSDSGKTVLGVIQKRACSVLASKIRTAPDILMYNVTEDNREELVNEISERLIHELRSKTDNR